MLEGVAAAPVELAASRAEPAQELWWQLWSAVAPLEGHLPTGPGSAERPPPGAALPASVLR